MTRDSEIADGAFDSASGKRPDVSPLSGEDDLRGEAARRPDRSGLSEPGQLEVDDVVRMGPSGAWALAGSAVFIVIALWIAFYVFIFLPRS